MYLAGTTMEKHCYFMIWDSHYCTLLYIHLIMFCIHQIIKYMFSVFVMIRICQWCGHSRYRHPRCIKKTRTYRIKWRVRWSGFVFENDSLNRKALQLDFKCGWRLFLESVFLTCYHKWSVPIFPLHLSLERFLETSFFGGNIIGIVFDILRGWLSSCMCGLFYE